MDPNVFKLLVILAVTTVVLLFLVGTWLFSLVMGTVPPFEQGIAKLDKLFKQLESASEESAQHLQAKVVDAAYVLGQQFFLGDWLITDDEQTSFVTNFSKATNLASHEDKLAAGMMLITWSQMMQELPSGSGICFLGRTNVDPSVRFDFVKTAVESAKRTYLDDQPKCEAEPPVHATESESLSFVKTPQERYDSFVQTAISCVSGWRFTRPENPELAADIDAWVEETRSKLVCVDVELV